MKRGLRVPWSVSHLFPQNSSDMTSHHSLLLILFVPWLYFEPWTSGIRTLLRAIALALSPSEHTFPQITSCLPLTFLWSQYSNIPLFLDHSELPENEHSYPLSLILAFFPPQSVLIVAQTSPLWTKPDQVCQGKPLLLTWLLVFGMLCLIALILISNPWVS